MSKRILLKIAYDGTEFSGFQRQPGRRTIEGMIDAAVTQLTGRPVEVIGASRTDAGVHALCNVAVFDTDAKIPAEKYSYALNRLLPPEIRIQASQEVPADFHPRRCSTEKTYEYHIYNAAFPDPVRRLYSFWTYRKLDTERMRRAAECLVGEHDFRSFCSTYTQAETTVRTITGIAVEESAERMPREIVIRVKGTGFLYNMVRIIAGTLLEAGAGRMEPEKVREILEACDRRKAGPTAPPEGLLLKDYCFTDGIPAPERPKDPETPEKGMNFSEKEFDMSADAGL
jgi:tRNA pseudouridine38-40 synthase